MRDGELNMLAFFAVRGILPEQIINGDALTQRFYYHAMEMYYKDRNDIIELFIKMLGGRINE